MLEQAKALEFLIEKHLTFENREPEEEDRDDTLRN